MKKSKSGEITEIRNIIIVIIVLVIVAAFILLFKGKGGETLELLKNFLRFGKGG